MNRLLCVTLISIASITTAASAQEPVDIGSRLELFVDDFLIDKMTGSAKLQLHRPMPQEVVLTTDRPWEGNTCAYYTIFQDGDIYRMYYRGSQHDDKGGKSTLTHQVTCYAESKDGSRWTRPNLGLFEFNGSKDNNIVWNGPGTHNFTPFKDGSPDCPADARYKALAGSGGGLVPLHSADAIHWQLTNSKPVITKGAFDSQNLAFWDAHAGFYREYHRGFRNGVRDIMAGTSKDFIHWTEPAYLEYPGAANEHLYTNAIRPYERAPHILIGFPTRFQPKRDQQVEPLFMSSRDGHSFKRWADEIIPVTAPKDRDGNRSNYMTWGLVKLPGKPNEYSVYATEAYYRGTESRLRRFTYRVDGFVSVQASAAGGELLTRPLRFAGKKLVINCAVAKEGSVRVELQDAAGKAIPNFALADCRPMVGDAIQQVVSWKTGDELGGLAERGVRLRFELKDADLFAIRFVE